MEKAKHSRSHTPTLHEFFKVYMPHTTSTYLRTPHAFTKFFNGNTPSKATIVDHVGKRWDIKLENMNNRLVFTYGWQQFVSDKCLEEADFLVFGYDGISTFYVKIFSKSGITKQAVNAGKLVPIVTLDDDSPDYDEKKAPAGVAKPKRVVMKNPHFVIPFSGWRLKSPSLELSKLVMRKLKIKLKSEINLRDEKDKVWPVMIHNIASKGGRTFLSTGWSDFRKAKNIKEGQMCAFKFVIGNDNVAHELLVRVRSPPSKCTK